VRLSFKKKKERRERKEEKRKERREEERRGEERRREERRGRVSFVSELNLRDETGFEKRPQQPREEQQT
jgi:hypothetical protein